MMYAGGRIVGVGGTFFSSGFFIMLASDISRRLGIR
jgi:hypothetical protein